MGQSSMSPWGMPALSPFGHQPSAAGPSAHDPTPPRIVPVVMHLNGVALHCLLLTSLSGLEEGLGQKQVIGASGHHLPNSHRTARVQLPRQEFDCCNALHGFAWLCNALH